MSLGLVFADALKPGHTLYDREMELVIEQVDRHVVGHVGVVGMDETGRTRYLVFESTETVWREDPTTITSRW